MSGRVFLGWTSTKQGLMWLVQGHNTVRPVRLEPATPRSRVNNSTTEPLCSLTSDWLRHTFLSTWIHNLNFWLAMLNFSSVWNQSLYFWSAMVYFLSIWSKILTSDWLWCTLQKPSFWLALLYILSFWKQNLNFWLAIVYILFLFQYDMDKKTLVQITKNVLIKIAIIFSFITLNICFGC